MPIKETKINKFETIAEDLRDLLNGQFHYLENVNAGDFSNSIKQVPNVYLKDNDQCILKLIQYGGKIYGLGYENSTTSDVTLYEYDSSTNVYNALTNGTVAGGTIRLYTPLFAIMDGYIYFDPGTNYVARYTIATNTMSATWKASTGGAHGGTIWQGSLWTWKDDNYIYKIDGATPDFVQKVKISTNQTIIELVPYGNYLAIVCTASQTSDEGVSRMMLWDGQNLSVTPFAEIVDIGSGVVAGADILDGLIYVGINFLNGKGFRLKAYSGGVFQTVYTYNGRKNLTGDNIRAQIASVLKAYTGYLYFMVVGARPGSTGASNYEMVLFRYGKTNLGQTNKLSAYKSLEVIPTVGNTLGVLGNDFIVNENEFFAGSLINDNFICAVVYEAGYKTRQIYTNPTTTYASQAGVIETSIYTGGNSYINKPLMGVSIMNTPLTTGQSIVLKYRKDAETTWTTLATEDTLNSISLELLADTNGLELPTFKEIAFRLELTGGAEVTGLLIKFNEENSTI
jgi:hypothetical protein